MATDNTEILEDIVGEWEFVLKGTKVVWEFVFYTYTQN